MESAMNRPGLSARAYNRILKVSRTIVNIEGSDRIATEHISEAIQYRSLDRRVS
jgi:magnesium chelatase family protein